MTLEPIPEAEDRVAGRPIAWVLAATVAAIVLSVGVVWALNAFALDGGGESAVTVTDQIPPSAPFSFETAPETVRAAQRAELDRWTWGNGRALPPVEVEIDRYLQESR